MDFAEVWMDNSEIQMEFCTDLDGQLQRFKQTYAGVQMDFYRSSTASLKIPF